MKLYINLKERMYPYHTSWPRAHGIGWCIISTLFDAMLLVLEDGEPSIEDPTCGIVLIFHGL